MFWRTAAHFTVCCSTLQCLLQHGHPRICLYTELCEGSDAHSMMNRMRACREEWRIHPLIICNGPKRIAAHRQRNNVVKGRGAAPPRGGRPTSNGVYMKLESNSFNNRPIGRRLSGPVNKSIDGRLIEGPRSCPSSWLGSKCSKRRKRRRKPAGTKRPW